MWIVQYIASKFYGTIYNIEMRRDGGSPLANVLDWRDLGCLAYEDACQLKESII